jgi:hypothetical protein
MDKPSQHKIVSSHEPFGNLPKAMLSADDVISGKEMQTVNSEVVP